MSVLWVPFRSDHSNVIVAMGLVLVMTSAGATRSRAAVLGAVASAAVTFTVFDTQPYEQFTIAKQSDVATAVSLVVVGLLTGELALRMARTRRNEASATSFLGHVRDAAARLAQGEELAVFIGAVAQELVVVAGVTECEFSAEPLDEDLPVVDRSGHLDVPPGEGTVRFGLPVWALGAVVGHFVMESNTPLSLTQSRLQVAMTLADQVGAALAAQAPLPPLPPSPRHDHSDAEMPVPQLRVVSAGDVRSAGSGGATAFQGLEDLPEGVQDRKPSVVGADCAFDQQLRSRFEARDLSASEERDGHRSGAVDDHALEGGNAGPGLDAHRVHASSDPDTLAVLHRVDRSRSGDSFERGLTSRRLGIVRHRRAS
jgi:hypothetical protein